MQVTKSANIKRRSEGSLGHLFSRRRETGRLEACNGIYLRKGSCFRKNQGAAGAFCAPGEKTAAERQNLPAGRLRRRFRILPLDFLQMERRKSACGHPSRFSVIPSKPHPQRIPYHCWKTGPGRRTSPPRRQWREAQSRTGSHAPSSITQQAPSNRIRPAALSSTMATRMALSPSL